MIWYTCNTIMNNICRYTMTLRFIFVHNLLDRQASSGSPLVEGLIMMDWGLTDLLEARVDIPVTQWIWTRLIYLCSPSLSKTLSTLCAENQGLEAGLSASAPDPHQAIQHLNFPP